MSPNLRYDFTISNNLFSKDRRNVPVWWDILSYQWDASMLTTGNYMSSYLNRDSGCLLRPVPRLFVNEQLAYRDIYPRGEVTVTPTTLRHGTQDTARASRCMQTEIYACWFQRITNTYLCSIPDKSSSYYHRFILTPTPDSPEPQSSDNRRSEHTTTNIWVSQSENIKCFFR